MYSEKERYGQDPRVVVRSKPATFNAPLKWKEPHTIFTCSWSDWFHEAADEWRPDAWDIINKTQRHTYLILTKRPDRMNENTVPWLSHPDYEPWANVWLGISAEDQERADDRIPRLLQTPAAVRFVSAEPLLGPLEFQVGRGYLEPFHEVNPMLQRTSRLDWIIVGGESGPDARACNLEWIRDIVSQSYRAGVPVFVKQLGRSLFDGYVNGHRPLGASAAPRWLKLKDAKGGDPVEWPEDLRVRQWPKERSGE